MQSIATRIIRVLLGAVLLVSGLNKFFAFIPEPPHGAAGAAFIAALVRTGYMMPLVGAVEVVCGTAFVVGRFVPLAALLFAPVAINLILFDGALDPAHGGPGLLVGAATIYLLWANFPSYEGLLRAHEGVVRRPRTKGRIDEGAPSDARD